MTNEQKVGLFFFVGVVLVFTAVELTMGTGLFSRGYNLWVTFPDVQGLTGGDKVRVAGVKAGKVDEIQLGKEGVRVRLRLDESAVVRRDSVAKLDFEALSGNRFVDISLGSPGAPRLKNGDTIQGETVPGITDMLSEFQRVGRSVDKLATSLNRNQQELLSNINSLVEENRRNLSATLANIQSITQKLDQGQGTLAKLLNDPKLYEQVTRLAANLEVVSERLARGQGTIGRLLYDDALYDQVQDTMARLDRTVGNFEEISRSVRNGNGTLGRLVTDDSLYVQAQDAVQGLHRATAGIEDQSPIAILGTLVSTLF